MTVMSPKGPRVLWPSWRYGPKGEAEIFQRAEDVPAGWYDHPKKHDPNYKPEPEYSEDDRAAAPAKPAKVYPITRDEMCAGLFQRHIPFDDDASDETLWALVQATQAMERHAEAQLDEMAAALAEREAAVAKREAALSEK